MAMHMAPNCAGLLSQARGVVQLLRHGWTPTFIFAYDEAWILVRRMRRIFRTATGGHNADADVGSRFERTASSVNVADPGASPW